MLTFETIGFGIGYRAIQMACLGSRRAFEDAISMLKAEHAREKAGRIPPDDPDEDDGFDDYSQDVGERIWEYDESLRLIREAFAITLYHFWEKEAVRFFKLKSYDHKRILAKASRDPRFEVDEESLNLLRLTVNCIKHGGGEELYSLRHDLFDLTLIPVVEGESWHTALRLTDEVLDAFFKAVKASGPKTPPAAGPIFEV